MIFHSEFFAADDNNPDVTRFFDASAPKTAALASAVWHSIVCVVPYDDKVLLGCCSTTSDADCSPIYSFTVSHSIVLLVLWAYPFYLLILNTHRTFCSPTIGILSGFILSHIQPSKSLEILLRVPDKDGQNSVELDVSRRESLFSGVGSTKHKMDTVGIKTHV